MRPKITTLIKNTTQLFSLKMIRTISIMGTMGRVY